jgi:hypothetical protein
MKVALEPKPRSRWIKARSIFDEPDFVVCPVSRLNRKAFPAKAHKVRRLASGSARMLADALGRSWMLQTKNS